MHPTRTVRLGCVDCHGGDADAILPPGTSNSTAEYERLKNRAHPQPDDPALKDVSANPKRLYAQWLRENYAYVRFVNPGDLRVAAETCGTAGCHAAEVLRVKTSMMTYGGLLWGAALYNNGSYPLKNEHFGESYSAAGLPQAIHTVPPPTPEETRLKGVIPEVTPLERWEISQPGNILRVFERGAGKKGEIGNPRPRRRIRPPRRQTRRPGLRHSACALILFFLVCKKRAFSIHCFRCPAPMTNQATIAPAAARDATWCMPTIARRSMPALMLNTAICGESFSSDPTIPKNESGHPIRHTFTRAMPSSQCMICHVHPGTNMETTYFGYTWWDNEADGAEDVSHRAAQSTEEERYQVAVRNPEGAAARGLWADPKFLDKVGQSGIQLTTQTVPIRRFPQSWLDFPCGL